MKKALRGLLSSKKAIATLAGLAVALGAKVGLDLDNEIVFGIFGLVAVYVGAQGAADVGKGAAQVEIEQLNRKN